MRSRRISQSSRVSPGTGGRHGSVFADGPLPLIIEPRFSAKTKRTKDCGGEGRRGIGKNIHDYERWQHGKLCGWDSHLVGSSPSAINALRFPEDISRAMRGSSLRGSVVRPRINFAPFVFGLRSALSKMSSLGPERGTMSSISTTESAWPGAPRAKVPR